MTDDFAINVLANGRMPTRATTGSTGLDCYLAEDVYIGAGKTVTAKLGFTITCFRRDLDIQVRPRSSLSRDGVLGHFGTIDVDYTGEVCAIMTNLTDTLKLFTAGYRVCQLVVSSHLLANVASDRERSGGFGSTGA